MAVIGLMWNINIGNEPKESVSHSPIALVAQVQFRVDNHPQ